MLPINRKIKTMISAMLLFMTMTISCQEAGPTLNLAFDYSDQINPTDMKNIYAIWLENDEGELQQIYACRKLVKGGLTDGNLVLPFWHLNRREGADDVSGATQSNRDFSVKASIDRERMGSRFTLYIEIDQSFQTNDWFIDKWKDQPAVLYATEINLDSDRREYILEPIGWTPMYETVVAGQIREVGVLVRDMRFITHSRIDDKPTFGAEDKEKSAIRSVSSITATITD